MFASYGYLIALSFKPTRAIEDELNDVHIVSSLSHRIGSYEKWQTRIDSRVLFQHI